MAVRMFTGESTFTMTDRMYAAPANGMAGVTRVRVHRSCPTPAVSFWSPITLGTDTDKHGRSRRSEVSHQ